MSDELWRSALGFDGYYEVSDQGSIRRLSRGKKLSPELVEKAKAMLSEGHTLHAVGEAVGVSHGTAFQIRKGITWNGNPKHRPVKTETGSDFYKYVWFCVDGKPRRYSAHRVVWEAFNGKIAEGMQINHKNLDRQDNRLENLELMTCGENIRHAIAAYRAEGKSHNDGGRYHAQKTARKERLAA